MPLTLLLEFLAQASPPGLDGLPGMPQWIQTSLTGILVGWLLFVREPNLNKERKEEREGRDKLLAEMVARHEAAIDELNKRHEQQQAAAAANFAATTDALVARFVDREKERQDYFRESLTVVTNHCEKELTGVGESIRRKLDEFQAVVDEVRKEMARRPRPSQ